MPRAMVLAAALSTTLARAGTAATPVTPGSATAPQKDKVVLLPTVVPTSEEPESRDPETQRRTERAANELNLVLGEALQDFGLTLAVPHQPQDQKLRALRPAALLDRAGSMWLVSPRLKARGAKLELELWVVPPNSRVVISGAEELEPEDLELRANVILRDLIEAAEPVRRAKGSAQGSAPQSPEPKPTDSPGHAVLALNSAALGGYLGYALARASASSDARLIYPLVALGASMGLGASMLVADEWRLTAGEAWYTSAGIWWPLASGLLLAESYRVAPQDAHMYGLVAGIGGLSLSTLAMSTTRIDEGDAVLAHSGGTYGLLLGGLAELIVRGKTDVSPSLGMGYGAGAGVLAAGLLASFVQVPATRVLLVDLSAGIGGLAAAAISSPLLFLEGEPVHRQNRLWLSSIVGGTLLGAAAGYFVTRRSGSSRNHTALNLSPSLYLQPGTSGSGVTVDLSGRW